MHEGAYDAIIRAEAGLKRLEVRAACMESLEAPHFLPAVGQGALGIECRTDRKDILELLAPMEHAPTRSCVTAERAFLRRLEGGCQVPIAGYAYLHNNTIILEGLVGEIDGSRILRTQCSGEAHNAKLLGQELADSLLQMGADKILARLYQQEH